MSSSSKQTKPPIYRGQYSSGKSSPSRRRHSSSSGPDEDHGSTTSKSKILEVSDDDEGDSTDGAESQDENQRLMESEGGNIQIEVPAHLVQMARSGASRQSGSSARPRMGRRFTLNPLIFAKVRVKICEKMIFF